MMRVRPCRPRTPSRLLAMLTVALCGPAAAGCFDARTPDGAQLYCSANADCPAGQRCDVRAHLCTEGAPDTTPPVVVAWTLEDDDGVVADVPGSDALVLTGTANERLGAAQMTLAPLVVDCEVDGEAFACALAIPAGFVGDGVQQLVLTLTDRAGNESEAERPVAIDTRAPTVEAGSVVIDVETAGVPSAVAFTTSVVRVTFVASEELAAGTEGEGARVTLDAAGALLPLALVSATGRVRTFVTTRDLVAPEGTHALRAVLTDRFGHESAPLDLGVITLVGADGLCPRPAGVLCTDVDGDGYFAIGDCVTGDDPDDTNPRAHPGAFEIAGDGVDNDGVGGDRPIDESEGLFVDCEAGDDGGDGSRTAPLATVVEAATRLVGTDRVIFVAARTTPCAAVETAVLRDIVGGLDPMTWAPTAARSRIAVDGQVSGVWHRVEVTGEPRGYGMVMVDCVLAQFVTDAGANRVIDSDVGWLFTNGPESTLRVIDSVVGSLQLRGATTLVRSRLRDGAEVFDNTSGELVAIASVLEGRDRAAIDVSGALRVALWFSTVRIVGVSGDAVLRTTGPVAIDIVASTLESTGGAVVQAPASGLRVVDANLVGGPLLVSGADTVTDVAGLDGCAAIGCREAARNSSAAPGGGDDFHLPPGSALRDRITAWPEGAPASAVVDFDRECRFDDAAADVGADEAH